MLKKWLKNRIATSKYFLRILRDRSYFDYFQSKGIHVVPNHFYFPIPDLSKLPPDYFDKTYDWNGIELNEEKQVGLLREFISDYKEEYSLFPFKGTNESFEYFWDNAGFECLDAISFYGMIRKYKPKRMIEVGGGNSTKLASKAILKNAAENHPCEFITIEPYPWKFHRKGVPGLTRLVDKPVQEIPVSFFKTLGENDILFIDTSHILKPASDVQHYFMNILQHLNKGVIIHFHDIFLPEEYPRKWVMVRHSFYNEQEILRAFLSFNDSFQVLFAGRHLQLTYPELEKSALDFYPAPITKAGSFWMQRIK